MDDAQYVFQQDVREKKITAHSANKKVRHTGCNLPSDYMTRKEKKAMNGEVKIMNIHKPMTYKFFKMMPADLQVEYIQFLHDTFNATVSDIATRFNISALTLRNYIYKRKLKLSIHSNRYTKLKEQEWEAFWAGNPPESDENDHSETNVSSEGESAVSENAPESDENDRSETNENERLCMTLDEVATEQPFSMGSMNVSLTDIRDWESVVKALSSFPLPAHNSVTITIHAFRHCNEVQH